MKLRRLLRKKSLQWRKLYYDTNTKKLSTKDGKTDAFTDYYNGVASEESYEELNGFDSSKKRDIKNMMKLFECGYG